MFPAVISSNLGRSRQLSSHVGSSRGRLQFSISIQNNEITPRGGLVVAMLDGLLSEHSITKSSSPTRLLDFKSNMAPRLSSDSLLTVFMRLLIHLF